MCRILSRAKAAEFLLDAETEEESLLWVKDRRQTRKRSRNFRNSTNSKPNAHSLDVVHLDLHRLPQNEFCEIIETETHAVYAEQGERPERVNDVGELFRSVLVPVSQAVKTPAHER